MGGIDQPTAEAAALQSRADGQHAEIAGPLAPVGDPVRSARRTWASLYGQGSRFRSERGDRSEPAPPQRIAPGRVDDSTVLLRMASPHTMSRMPPIGVSVVDDAGLQFVRQWILSLDFSHRKEIAP